MQGWLSLFVDTDNNLQHIASTITKQAVFALDITPKLYGINTTVSPSSTVRNLHAPKTKQTDTAFRLAVNMRKNGYSLLLDFSYNHQLMAGGADVDTATYTVSYRYTKGKNELGFEFGGINREPHPGGFTGSYKAFVFWTRRFDPKIARDVEKSVSKQVKGKYLERKFDPSLFTLLIPDLPMGKAMKILEAYRVRSPIRQGNLLIYEARVFEGVEQRQRLILVDSSPGKLKKMAFIISYESWGEHMILCNRLNG